MDYRKLLAEHVKNGAEMTVSCIEVPTKNAANQLGVLSADNKGQVTAFDEKPSKPHPLLDAPEYCLASMGNYVVNAEVLYQLLDADAKTLESEHDFGKNVIPDIIDHHKVFAHRFRGADGCQIPYWRDVGTIDSYWRAHMDLLNNSDMLNLADPSWPVQGSVLSSAPTQIRGGAQKGQCDLNQILIGGGCQLNNCRIHNTVLSSNCIIGDGASLEGCVLLPDVTVEAGAKLKNVIVDKGVTIPASVAIDDVNIARHSGFPVSEKGVVLITQKVIDGFVGADLHIDIPQKASSVRTFRRLSSELTARNTGYPKVPSALNER